MEIEKFEQDKLVRSWIRRYEIVESEGDESKLAEELYWSYEKLDEICWEHPFKAFEIILDILKASKNEYVLSNLAAGPLESLLSRHGDQILTLVEDEVKSSPEFRELLQGVWQNTMSDDLWQKVKQLVSNGT